MSHYISSVSIHNFRSINKVNLRIGFLSPLVGQNNVGKSNILNAIQWLIKPSALDPSYFRDPKKEISVQADIEGLNDDLLNNHLFEKHAERIKAFVQNECLKIQRVLPAGQKNVASAKLQVFNSDSNEFVSNPNGIDSALKNLFPEPVRIEAMVDAPEDVAKNKTSSTLGRLIAQLTEPIALQNQKKFDRIFSALTQSLSCDGEDRPEELRNFDIEATEVLSSFFPGLGLSVDFPSPKLPDLLKSGTVKVQEEMDGIRRNFTDLGHGAQRSIQMAMVQLLAQRSQNQTELPRCTLLLIDEPELYLHPQAIEQIRLSFGRLAQNGYQVIFSTHSPLMIGRNELPQTTIISKNDRKIGTEANQRALDVVEKTFSDNRAKQAQMLFELANSKEVLFASRVLLVEGRTEMAILPTLYESITGRTLGADKIGLVEMSGCGDLCKAISILNDMGIEAFALTDLDFAFTEGAKKGNILDPEDSRILAIKQWFADNKESHDITLSSEGWPTKQSEGGAEGAFKKMAQDPLNGEHINSLHDELKTRNIWIWKSGSIEDVLGLTIKNDPECIAAFCSEMDNGNLGVLKDKAASEAFCKWLNNPLELENILDSVELIEEDTLETVV